MHVWLITVGEPLPGLSGNSRPWRTGLLARELIHRGHTVTWWTSRVDHFRKQFFVADGASAQPEPGLTLRFLEGRLYRRNISIARLWNHWQVGRHFRVESAGAPAPDVILCSFPTIELSLEAVRFAAPRRIPVALDVRDLWPDIFLQPAPAFLRGALKTLLWPYFSATRRALSRADGLLGVSAGYLEWGLARAGRAQGAMDRVFPLAYSLPDPTPATRAAGSELLARLDVKSGSIVCLFAGTLGRTYDLQPVLECAAKFAAERQPFHFLICGDGERAPEWRAAAASLHNVSFTGWLDQNAMRAALSVADIGLAAYAAAAPQGLPNKVIEYLAASLPVVSSLTGETEQLLSREDCGLTYKAGDPASLNGVLLALATLAGRQRLARNARRIFEACFRAETVFAQLAEYLETLAGPADAERAVRLRNGQGAM